MITFPSKNSAMLSNFGIGHLNITEAASLIAKCLFCEGAIEVDYQVEAVSLHDPKLDSVLKEHITFYEEKLVLGIGKGTLKSELIKRDINELIIKEETFVECGILYDWLEERGVELGDLYHLDYLSEITNLLEVLENTLQKEKIRIKNPDLIKKYEQDKECDYLSLYNKIDLLETELATHKAENTVKSLSTRTRETTLKIIIGMAIKGYAYNPKAAKNAAVSEIASDLERLGIAVGDDTIRKWLNEAREFLPQEVGES